MLQKFTLESLKDLDGGKAGMAFEQHVRRASLDCLDRPGDESARKVTLEAVIVPVRNDDGTCDGVTIQFHSSSAVPKHRTKLYSMALRANGMLAFNPDAPDNVNQSTMLDDQ
jgi:hypothetical protein